MTTMTLKVARIGNSRGVRLPASSLRRYHIRDTVVMEERTDGILLRPARRTIEKLSWEDTARAMAASGEDWTAWDRTAGDGLDHVPWTPSGAKAAESRTRHRARAVRGKRR